jgi:hypothetical protein
MESNAVFEKDSCSGDSKQCIILKIFGFIVEHSSLFYDCYRFKKLMVIGKNIFSVR